MTTMPDFEEKARRLVYVLNMMVDASTIERLKLELEAAYYAREPRVKELEAALTSLLDARAMKATLGANDPLYKSSKKMAWSLAERAMNGRDDQQLKAE